MPITIIFAEHLIFLSQLSATGAISTQSLYTRRAASGAQRDFLEIFPQHLERQQFIPRFSILIPIIFAEQILPKLPNCLGIMIDSGSSRSLPGSLDGLRGKLSGRSLGVFAAWNTNGSGVTSPHTCRTRLVMAVECAINTSAGINNFNPKKYTNFF